MKRIRTLLAQKRTQARATFQKAIVAATQQKALAIRRNGGCKPSPQSLGEGQDPMSIQALQKSQERQLNADRAVVTKMINDSKGALKSVKSAAEQEMRLAQDSKKVKYAHISKEAKDAAAKQKAAHAKRKAEDEGLAKNFRIVSKYGKRMTTASVNANTAKLAMTRVRVKAEAKVDADLNKQLAQVMSSFKNKMNGYQRSAKLDKLEADKEFKRSEDEIKRSLASKLKNARNTRKKSEQDAAAVLRRKRAAAIADKANAMKQVFKRESIQDQKNLEKMDQVGEDADKRLQHQKVGGIATSRAGCGSAPCQKSPHQI